MLNSIEVIKENIMEFNGTGMYMALFLVGITYIYLTEKNKKIMHFFVTFSILDFILILNPIFYKTFSSVITKDVYWRMFWILPLGLIISYCSTKIILEKEDCKKEQIILFIATIIIITTSGKFIYNKQNYKKYDNWYKIPQEAYEVCVAISEDNLNNKLVMAPPELIPYFRQYSADIHLIYGRVPNGYENNELVVAFNNNDMRFVVPKCLERKCNYIVVNPTLRDNEFLIDNGFKLLGNTENYLIYKLNE